MVPTQITPETRDQEIRRLLYNSWHRGCKETDELLGKFARAELFNMTDQELYEYGQFLEEDDWDIFNWLTGKLPMPEQYHAGVVQKLMQFCFVN